MSHSIGLADAIEALRAELQGAIERGRNEQLRFTLSPIELTLEVEVHKDVEGKIGWHVVEIGAGADKSRTQTLTLTLEPGWLVDGQYLPSSQWTIADSTVGDGGVKTRQR
ncbi:trypco2 family protein [Nocardia sp. NPDC052566]|uniref:trypco2 family protein n=1 Tax=Nocardia sp. NPDC052566 TaxID=3364330 RepID=UPI0037C90326